MNDTIYILAGNAHEADSWRQHQQIGKANCRYISNEHALRGLSQPRIVVLPGFWQRKDVWEIWNYLAISRPVDWSTGKPISDRMFQNTANTNAHDSRPIEERPKNQSVKRFKTIKSRHDLRASV